MNNPEIWVYSKDGGFGKSGEKKKAEVGNFGMEGKFVWRGYRKSSREEDEEENVI